MTPVAAIRTCLRKYVTFRGRAARPEFWWFFLFVLVGNALTGALDGALFGTDALALETGEGSFRASATQSGPFGLIFALGTLLPLIAVGWRRMQDTGRSGLHLFYPVIVMIGIASFSGLISALFGGGTTGPLGGIAGLVLIFAGIVLIVSPLIVIWWLTRPSQPGPNPFGPPPAHPEATA